MPSYKPKVQILLTEEYHQKFKSLCDTERRSDSVMGALMIEKYINDYEKMHGEIAIAEKPTRKEAIDAQKQTIKERHNQPVGKTMIKSLKNGFDYGNASK